MSSCVLRNWVLLMCPLLPFRMNDEWCISEGSSINSLYLVALIKLCVIPPLFFCILLTALGKDDVSRKWRCKHCISLELYRMKGNAVYEQITLFLFYFETLTNHPNGRDFVWTVLGCYWHEIVDYNHEASTILVNFDNVKEKYFLVLHYKMQWLGVIALP